MNITEALNLWLKSKAISDDTRETFGRISIGLPVSTGAVRDAVIDALGVNATRFGQSMDRRLGRDAAMLIHRAYGVDEKKPSEDDKPAVLADVRELLRECMPDLRARIETARAALERAERQYQSALAVVDG